MGVSKSRSGTGKRKAPRSAFVKGDPRINRKGRPPLSQAQREFRQKLHDMQGDILKAVAHLVKVREPSVTNKLIEKLAGKDAEAVDLTVTDKRQDLSKLSVEELREYRRLATLAESRDHDGD